MKISQLRFVNFRSYADQTFKLSKLTVFRGTNAAGKSTIEQGIELNLASHAEGTTADGKGAKNLVRMGEKKALIDLIIESEGENDTTVSRRVEMAINGETASGSRLVTDPNDESYGGGQEWLQWLGKQKATLSALINNRYFMDLDEDRQKDLLTAIIMPSEYAWPETLRPLCNEFKLAINWTRTPFEILKEGYDLAYKARTGVNRAVKEFRMPDAPTHEPEGDVTEIRARLKERSSEINEAQKQRAELLAGSNQWELKHDAIQSKISAAIERITRQKQAVDSATDLMLSPTKLKDLKKIAEKAAEAAELEKQMATLEIELKMKRETSKRVQTLGDGAACETCKRAFSEADIASIAGPLLTAVNELIDKQKAAIDARKKLGDPAGAAADVQRHQDAAKDRDRAAAFLAEEETVEKRSRKELDELGPKVKVDTTEADALIADLTERIRMGNEALQLRMRYDASLDEVAKAKERKQALEREQAELEKLVQYFGVDARTSMLKESVGVFVDSMNVVLESWGYCCHLSLEPYNFTIRFLRGGKPYDVPLRFLSKSQRYRFATAFQVALATISGFYFVIVDEADIHDAEGRDSLFDALMSANLDQVIVMSTDERMDVPHIPDAVFYRLDDGAARGEVPTTKVRTLVPLKG